MIGRLLSTPVFALACAISLPAQAPPAWSTLSIPSGVNDVEVVSIGKLTAYRDGNVLHCYSAFTRRWHALNVSTTASLRLTNDCLLVQDGVTWYGFASCRGTFEPLPVSAQAQLLNPVGRDNDSILLVRDGTSLHAFSGFVGTWVTRTIGPSIGWSVQRHVALLAEGNLVSGMDAFTGQWHDQAVTTPPANLSTDGTAGFAYGPTEVLAFSAMKPGWSQAPAIAGATFVRNDDWGLFYDTTQMLAYSGTQGRFALAPLGATLVTANEDCFAIVNTSLGFVAYSAIRGNFSPPLAPTTARVRQNTAVATLVDGQQVIGYSASRNSIATMTLNSSLEETASSVAYAIDAGTGLAHCFSAITGQWYAPPGDVLPVTPQITTTSALLTTSTGTRAFSARTGAFVPLVAANLTLLGNSSVAVAGAWNTTDLFAFDARTDQWKGLSRATTGPMILQIWRTAMFAVDGTMVAGFGTQDGEWSTTTMPEAYVAGRANSESSRIVTANYILAHAAVAELTSAAQFPDFRRVFPAGATLRLYLPIGAGDLALLASGLFAATPTPVPGFRTLVLEPSTIATILILPPPGSVRTEIQLPIPASPWLVGTEWAFQALVAPQTGAAYLTGPAAVLVL